VPVVVAQSKPEAEAVERCLRCGALMEWRQSTWQCPACRFKLGCCEGEACEPD
jgi:rubrerythrin